MIALLLGDLYYKYNNSGEEKNGNQSRIEGRIVC